MQEAGSQQAGTLVTGLLLPKPPLDWPLAACPEPSLPCPVSPIPQLYHNPIAASIAAIHGTVEQAL